MSPAPTLIPDELSTVMRDDAESAYQSMLGETWGLIQSHQHDTAPPHRVTTGDGYIDSEFGWGPYQWYEEKNASAPDVLSGIATDVVSRFMRDVSDVRRPLGREDVEWRESDQDFQVQLEREVPKKLRELFNKHKGLSVEGNWKWRVVATTSRYPGNSAAYRRGIAMGIGYYPSSSISAGTAEDP